MPKETTPDQGKRVLIITYYWPPSGGAGVHRWLKMSKYLAVNNTCYVYTPANPDFALKDESLVVKIDPSIHVLKRKIMEPYFLYRAFVKKSDKAHVNQPSSVAEGGGFIKKLGKWGRGNIFIPDPRVFWVKPSYKYLKKVIQDEKIDVVITTGPPHSMHLIGLKLKSFFGANLNWIADFRDPWTNIDFYDKLTIGKRADKKHRRLEKEVVASADTVVTVSENWGKDFEALGAQKVAVITNGFDQVDYRIQPIEQQGMFKLTHLGSINADRNPIALWKAMALLKEQNKAFADLLVVRLIGNVHANIIASIAEFGLQDQVKLIPNLPHKKALDELYDSSISLLLLNDTKNIDGIIPGKLFEYIGAGRPIFAIGKTTGDTGKIITENNLGAITPFNDVEAAKNVLLSFFTSFQRGELKAFSTDDLNKFSIQALSEKFETLF